MKFRAAERDSPEISLTPLIDVVFLLLIFFMVSTTFERHSELSIELPEASADASVRDDAIIDVVIDAGGSVYVEGRPLADPRVESLQRALAERRGRVRLAAGGDRRRCADTASVGRHGHGRGAPGGALPADLRGAALGGAAGTAIGGAAGLMCCASDIRPLFAALRLHLPAATRRRNP